MNRDADMGTPLPSLDEVIARCEEKARQDCRERLFGMFNYDYSTDDAAYMIGLVRHALTSSLRSPDSMAAYRFVTGTLLKAAANDWRVYENPYELRDFRKCLVGALTTVGEQLHSELSGIPADRYNAPIACPPDISLCYDVPEFTPFIGIGAGLDGRCAHFRVVKPGPRGADAVLGRPGAGAGLLSKYSFIHGDQRDY